MQNLYISAFATLCAELATLPICNVRTIYQNTHNNKIYDIVHNIFRQKGIPGFYAASIPAISSQVVSTSSKYVLYRYFNNTNFSYKPVNGAISGILSSLLTHPIDTFKIHWQMGKPIHPEFQKYGLHLFYRGYSKTFIKVSVSSSLFFPLYDYSNEKLNNVFISSFLSAVISTFIIHPIDYLKTRHIYGLSLYNGFHPKFYYKGFSLSLLRIVPNFIIIMTLIDFLSKN